MIRKTKTYTNEKRKQVIAAVKKSGKVQVTLKRFRVPYTTYREWVSPKPKRKATAESRWQKRYNKLLGLLQYIEMHLDDLCRRLK